MAINVDKYIGDILAGNATLTGLLGGASNVKYGRPKSFDTLPIVTFEIASNIQGNKTTFDDKSFGRDLAVNIDVWVSNNASPIAIIEAVTNVMNANDFFLTADRNVAEINTEVTHRHLVFTSTKMNTQLSA